VPNATLNIAQPINVTTTDANGDYAFIEQEPPRTKGWGCCRPTLRQLQRRWFPRLSPAAQQLCHRKLAGGAHRPPDHPRQQNIGSQSLPVGNIFFRLQGNGVDQLMVTGLNGQTWADLDAGTYTVTVLPEYLPPDTTVSPTSRTVVVTNNTFANATFTVTPAQSLAVGCRVGGAGFRLHGGSVRRQWQPGGDG
jgi:hypothetical protein